MSPRSSFLSRSQARNRIRSISRNSLGCSALQVHTGDSGPFAEGAWNAGRVARAPRSIGRLPTSRGWRTSLKCQLQCPFARHATDPASRVRCSSAVTSTKTATRVPLKTTMLEQLNSRRVDRPCRRRVADFLARDPRNPRAYGTWLLTMQSHRELRARWSAFRGVREFNAEPARWTLSGAAEVIRSVMHPACSKRSPLAWQNKTYFQEKSVRERRGLIRSAAPRRDQDAKP